MSDRAADLKALVTRKSGLLEELRAANDRHAAAPSVERAAREWEEIKAIKAQLAEVSAQQRRLTAAGGLVVSEHAMLRYVERVIGISRAELEAMVVPEAVREAVRRLGASTAVIDCGGHKLRIENGVVTTVVTGEDA